MFDEIVKKMSVHELNRHQKRDEMIYKTDEASGDGWQIMLGDSCERIKEIPDDTIGLSVFSPPFPGMYAYTNSARDIGNVKDFSQLIAHFAFLMQDIHRITMPGRVCCVHLTQEPVFKGRDGYVGLRDFRGDVISAMTAAGWFYYSEVTIDKNPMLKASRTKEGTLLFKTLAKDSAGSRPALADYLLVFKKDGDNPIPIKSGVSEKYHNKDGWITADEWCEWAAPVWYRAMPKEKSPYQPWQGNYPSRHQSTDGISETDVLRNFTEGKGEQDEKHLCPLQLGVIERCIKLWSAPGDTVFSPFTGIGSEGYQAIKLHRKFIGCELKESYWKVACDNLNRAVDEMKATTLL
jgi:DNA modification methylase